MNKNTKKYTLDDVKQSMPKMKARRDAVWVKLWPRPVSYPLAVLALNAKLTPNMVSVMSIIDVLLSTALLCVNHGVAIAAGLVLLNAFIVFDCVDGTMARTLKVNSYMGEFYDALGGYAICAFPLLALGICAFHTGRTAFFGDGVLTIVLGAFGSVCDIFSRLVYQKYTANEMIANYKKGVPLIRENDSFYKEQSELSLTYLRLEIDRQFGAGGFFPPLAVIAYALRCLDLFVGAYALYHILAYVAVMFIFCKKATRYDHPLE